MKQSQTGKPDEENYALLDSGEEEKLERFGAYTTIRPDPQALWKKRLPKNIWDNADATYERTGATGAWKFRRPLPESWTISIGDISAIIRLTSFKHTGLFPEQLPNWEWAEKLIKNAGRPISVLNLFGYTGGATLSAARAGASVCHVDSSKKALEWARANAQASNLSDAPIRWMMEDALTFVQREVKRGNHYDAIIMDPPSFGHGPKDEIWKIERDFLPLFDACLALLSDKPLFFILNGYASGYSSLVFAHNLNTLRVARGGVIEHGELSIFETGAHGRKLPAGIFARWSAEQKTTPPVSASPDGK